MTLKVCMRHCVLEYFQICSNDDPELTLTYFTAKPNLIPDVFVWEKGKIMDFSETMVVYDIKVGRFNLLNEYMNHYEYQRSRSFTELRPMSLGFNIFNLDAETAMPIEAKFHMEPPCDVGNEHLFKCSRSHDHAHKSYSDKLQKYFLRNQEADDFETWYTASGTRVLTIFHMMTLGWPWLFLWQGQICFRMLLHGWKLIQHWVLMCFQVCSNSTYPQHSDNAPLHCIICTVYPLTARTRQMLNWD